MQESRSVKICAILCQPTSCNALMIVLSEVRSVRSTFHCQQEVSALAGKTQQGCQINLIEAILSWFIV